MMERSFRVLTSLSFGLAIIAGCQNWSSMTGGLPLQNPSRVPPPGTGTYPTSTSYYNNANSPLPTNQAKGLAPSTSASFNGAPVVRASWQAEPAPKPAGAGKIASGSISKDVFPANVELSSAITEAPARSEFTATSANGLPSVPSTASLSDSTPEPKLDWQSPR